jgi:hypothetical protein
MRGLTKNALRKIDLTSKGWEYASEMVLKATRVGLKIDEVPVTFYKDREGRFSHHRRAGFWSPWVAGWINLKVMLVYSPDSFLIKPGIFLALLGIIISVLSLSGSVRVGPIQFGLYMGLLGMALVVLGYSLFQAGVFARNMHKLRAGIESLINKKITYTIGMVSAGAMFFSGMIIDINFLIAYINHQFSLSEYSQIAVFGLLLIILGVQTFSFSLILELNRRVNSIGGKYE